MALKGSIWYHSEPSIVPYSPNQFLGWDFFCRFLQQTGSRLCCTDLTCPLNFLRILLSVLFRRLKNLSSGTNDQFQKYKSEFSRKSCLFICVYCCFCQIGEQLVKIQDSLFRNWLLDPESKELSLILKSSINSENINLYVKHDCWVQNANNDSTGKSFSEARNIWRTCCVPKLF